MGDVSVAGWWGFGGAVCALLPAFTAVFVCVCCPRLLGPLPPIAGSAVRLSLGAGGAHPYPARRGEAVVMSEEGWDVLSPACGGRREAFAAIAPLSRKQL